jgi:hypothetical protein
LVVVRAYPQHAHTNTVVMLLIQLLTQLAPPVLEMSTRSDPVLRETCNHMAVAVCQLGAQLGEHHTNLLFGADADAGAGQFLAKLLLQCTAHSCRAVVSNALDVWHCLQQLERDERAPWTIDECVHFV